MSHGYTGHIEAERRFPHKVDVPVPLGGLGERLNDMLEWCRDRGRPERWDCHGITDWRRRDQRGAPMDFARFYFLEEADAEAFRREWSAP